MKRIFGLFCLLSISFYSLAYANKYFPDSLNSEWLYSDGYQKTIVRVTASDNSPEGEKTFTIVEVTNDDLTVTHNYKILNGSIVEYLSSTYSDIMPRNQVEQYDPPHVIMKASLKAGDSWVVSKTGITTTRQVVSFVPIKTKAGTFKNCMKIKEIKSYPGQNPAINYYWYAPNVGLVKAQEYARSTAQLIKYKIF